MAALISREELALVLDEDISTERFDALYNIGLRIIRTGYAGDPEAAEGHARDVIIGVLQGVVVRIMTNPQGARIVGTLSAHVTFGGADAHVANVFSLTEFEREDLSAVSPKPNDSPVFSIRTRAKPYAVYRPYSAYPYPYQQYGAGYGDGYGFGC